MKLVGLKMLMSVPLQTNVVFIFFLYCGFGRPISRQLLVLVTELCDWISSFLSK